jgi:hypothetical protein
VINRHQIIVDQTRTGHPELKRVNLRALNDLVTDACFCMPLFFLRRQLSWGLVGQITQPKPKINKKKPGHPDEPIKPVERQRDTTKSKINQTKHN